jgi:hypothetical protein
MKLRDFLDSMHLRMPLVTKCVGRAGVVLGPILGLLHLVGGAVRCRSAHRRSVGSAGGPIFHPARFRTVFALVGLVGRQNWSGPA